MLANENMFKVYDDVQRHWDDVMMAPRWLDKRTSCCAYGSGLIIGGSARNSTGRHVVQLDFNTRETTQLVDLPIPIQSPGITYTDQSVYIIGGSHCKEKSKRVFCYSTDGKSEWIKLKPLIHAVVRPIVLSDETHIYVIGGNTTSTQDSSKTLKKGCKLTQIYDKLNGVWEIRRNTPLACNNSLTGGVLWNNRPVVVTPSAYMSLHLQGKMWHVQAYDECAEWITPVVCGNTLYACVRYKHRRSFRRYDPKYKRWIKQNVNVHSIKNTSLFFCYNNE